MQHRYYYRRIFLTFYFVLIVGSSQAQATDIRNAVLKIFVTANSMDYYRPWQAHGSAGRTGSGVVIPGNKILTNAHVIGDHTFIQVRKGSDPQKYTAKVIAIGNDCDLALLSVDDESYFNRITNLFLINDKR